jgi:hypothetical protein
VPLGIDVDRDLPTHESALSVGGSFERAPVSLVELELRPHAGIDQANARWRSVGELGVMRA